MRNPDIYLNLVRPSAPILVLAGDIGWPEAAVTKHFLTWCGQNWKRVIWVFGNHEYYLRKPLRDMWKNHKTILTMETKELHGRALIDEIPNLVLLQNESVCFPEFPELVFWGSTFWTNIPSSEATRAYMSLNDFKYLAVDAGGSIQEFRIEEWNRFHQNARAHLQGFLESDQVLGKKVVVITHHLPSYSVIQEKFKQNPLNFGYASNSDDLLAHSAIAAWICGHSHGSVELHEPTQIVLNAHGYPGESVTGYNPAKVVTV